MNYKKIKNKVIIAGTILCIFPSAFAKEITYPENLHGGVYIRSDYVPSTCQMNACNAVNIYMVKEFFDNLDDSNRIYYDFDLYPARLQRIAKNEHSALAYCMFDMTTVVKNNVDQKKLAQVVNSLSKMIKTYYKSHDYDQSMNIKVQFEIVANKQKTMINFHSMYTKLQKDNNVEFILPEDFAKYFGEFLHNQKNPVITNSTEEIKIKFENSYITNNYNYLENHQ